MNKQTSPPAQTKFIIVTVLISFSFSLAIAEWVLRYQRQQIESSDRMEPGMVLYDAQLGWKLKPFWQGAHHHYDFDVSYKIDSNGFRSSTANNPVPKNNPSYSVVGDSFTFGIGVPGAKTFTSLLNLQDTQNRAYRNFGIPGYSTDQQLLLIERTPAIDKNVLLVVYLGNDIFDNTRPYPLQADHGKPFFKLEDGHLSLKNTPVPLAQKPAEARKETLTKIVLGDTHTDSSLSSWLSQFELVRRTGLISTKQTLSADIMKTRFHEQLQLFIAIIHKIDYLVQSRGGKLHIVLLPGHSYVQQPDSLSASYQEYFRQYITSRFEKNAGLPATDISVIDLASKLKALHQSGEHDLYFPNEGHLSPAGHRQVASYILSSLNSDMNSGIKPVTGSHAENMR